MEETVKFTISLIIIIVVSFLYGFGDRQSSKRLLEQVDVTNALISVRVYEKGKPIKGLKKANFRIIENGREMRINACYMGEKQLKPKSKGENFAAKTGISPRLFVLIFNIVDGRLDINTGIDFFFDQILQPNDRLILRTNNFFLKDRRVLNPQAEKKKIKKILRLEMRWARMTMGAMTNTLNLFIKEYEDIINFNATRTGGGGVGVGGERDVDPDGLIEKAVRSFITKYRVLLKEFRKTMIQVPLKEYIHLAAYLQDQKLEKWVLNFCQIARFPQPERNSELEQHIISRGYYLDINAAVNIPGSLPTDNIGKLFVNTGATFHTLLMKYQGESFNDMKGYLEFKTITSSAEGVLRKISKMTGGGVLRSNRLNNLYDNISAQKDIYYVLAYKTRPIPWKKKRRVTVLVNNKNYNLVYDNQKRTRYFRKAENKIITKMKEQRPEIRISRVNAAKGIIKILISDYLLAPDTYPAVGKILVRLQVLDEKSKVVVDKKRTSETMKQRLFFSIKLSQLEKGHYDVVVMVHDLLTGKEDLAVQEVLI